MCAVTSHGLHDLEAVELVGVGAAGGGGGECVDMYAGLCATSTVCTGVWRYFSPDEHVQHDDVVALSRTAMGLSPGHQPLPRI